MKMLIVLSVLLGLTLGAPNFHPLSDEMVDYINSLNLTWKARKNFDESQLSYIKRLSGTILENPPYKRLTGKKISIAEDIPATFDAREYWPECPSIGLIRDQGACRSCWAQSAVEAISDRICIASKGQINVNISAEDLTGCCKDSPDSLFGCDGCNFGYSFSGWKYWVERGLVTGDLYNGGGCKPYSFPPSVLRISEICKQHERPECLRECQSGYPKSYEEDKFFGQTWGVLIKQSVEEIQTEILQNGPVTASFKVYQDFYNYTKGVYIQASDVKKDDHVIKILGWGIEDGVDYWLAANSWGTGWGKLDGFFKIRRGTNECKIESYISFGSPRI